MLVADIIRQAAVESGASPSFNPDEIPDDVMEIGRSLLRDKILLSLTCDRTLEVTVTCITCPVSYDKNRNEWYIILNYLPHDWEGYICGRMLEPSLTSENMLIDPNLFTAAVSRLKGLDFFKVENFPQWDNGFPRKVAVWCSDGKLVEGTFEFNDGRAYLVSTAIVMNNGLEVNVPFPIVRVNDVIVGSCEKLVFTYRDEYEMKPNGSNAYTTEEYEDAVKIMLKRECNGYARVIVPVPMVITETENDIWGELKIPMKFKPYLQDILAYMYAVEYGLQTKQDMLGLAAQSLNLVKKAKKPVQAEMDVHKHVRNILTGYGRPRH